VSKVLTTGEICVDLNPLIYAILPAADGIDKVKGHSKSQLRPGTPEAVDAAIDANLVSRLLPELQRHLDSLVGKDFGTEGNRDLAKALTRLARRLGVAFECPNCSAPAGSIRYSQYGMNRSSIWRYEHSNHLRHGGSATLGPLSLVLLTRDKKSFRPHT